MNPAHFHLMVNHLPIIFPIVGAIVMTIGLIFASAAVQRTAFIIFVIGALTSITAMVSGEGAEDIVEKISGISEQVIEHHEETAERFSILTYILGVMSIFGLWSSIKEKTFTLMTNYIVLLFSLIVIYFGSETGTSGGEIRHTEIRKNDSPLQESVNKSEEKE